MGKRRVALLLPFVLLLSSCTLDPEGRKQRLLETGNRYYDSGQFKEASIIYQRAIQQDRRFGEAYYRLGLTELALGRISRAVAALNRAAELQPENEDAYERLANLYIAVMRANAADKEDYLGEINRLTERAEAHFPNSFPVHRVRGIIALEMEDYETAERRLRQAMEEKPDDQSVAILIAQCYRGTGRPEEAEQLLRSFIKEHEASDLVSDYLYVRLFEENRRDEALEILQAKIARNPGGLQDSMQLARHYFLVGERAAMEKALEGSLAVDGAGANAYRAVGDFYSALGMFDRADEVYRRGADVAPESRADLLLHRAQALTMLSREQEAFELVQEVLQDDRENSQAIALRGALRLKTGDMDALQDAINDFESVLTRMPENVVLRYDLAEAYLAAGNRERARVEFQQAIEKRPDYMPPRYGLAKVYIGSEQYAQAITAAEEILAIRPGDRRAELIRSAAWMRMGERSQARASLQQMLTKTPDSPEPTYQLAELNLQEGNYAEAERYFRRLATADPPDSRAIVGLAEVRILTGRREEGLEMLQEQFDSNPTDIRWELALGRLAARVHSWDQAEQVLKSVLSKQAGNPVATKYLADVYFQTGRLDEALTTFQTAAQLGPTDHVPHLYQALIYERKRDFARAVASYERAIELAPANAAALNNLAYLLAETTDELDRAMTLAQRAVRALPSDANVADTLGWIYIKKNLNDDAIRIFDDLVARQPGQVAWRYHLAMALYQKGDFSRARRELETALKNQPSQAEETDIRRLLAKVTS